jgi:hypothetical protein
LELHEAGSKEELLKNLANVFCDESYDAFREELSNIAEGKTQFSWEGVNQTLQGRQLDINLTWSAAPGHEKDLSKVIISIVDITDANRRKKDCGQPRLNIAISSRMQQRVFSSRSRPGNSSLPIRHWPTCWAMTRPKN